MAGVELILTPVVYADPGSGLCQDKPDGQSDSVCPSCNKRYLAFQIK